MERDTSLAHQESKKTGSRNNWRYKYNESCNESESQWDIRWWLRSVGSLCKHTALISSSVVQSCWINHLFPAFTCAVDYSVNDWKSIRGLRRSGIVSLRWCAVFRRGGCSLQWQDDLLNISIGWFSIINFSKLQFENFYYHSPPANRNKIQNDQSWCNCVVHN